MIVPRNRVTEISFHSTRPYSDPYHDVDLDVLFTSPEGEVFRVPAFWIQDNLWKVRFSGSIHGEYTYETQSSETGDDGLHGRSGRIFVETGGSENPLFRHGRLRVASDGRHFEHHDGTPFFWIGDTWWMGLSTRLDWPQGFKKLAADRLAKGFNIIQIVAGPYPDMGPGDARGRNEAGFPFVDNFQRINPAYYDHADLKIGHLVESGLVPCIVGMWGYYLPLIGVERVNRFWRYLVARYGAYPVVWCICGEATMPYYLSEEREEDASRQKKGWTEVMAHVREIDGYRNLITIHPPRQGREQVENPGLMDFEMLQMGHHELASVSATIELVRRSVVAEPVMPVINSEVNYEGINGRCWQNIQRLCFYHSILNGAAGHTYGANGIWQMSTRENPYGPSPHGRCWGNTPWQEAAQLPGSRQIGIGGRFICRFRWWELQCRPDWVGESRPANDPYRTVAVGIPGQLRILYMPFCWDPTPVRAIEAGVSYTATYVDPCTGEETSLGDVDPSPEGEWSPPFPPECHDWLLVMVARD